MAARECEEGAHGRCAPCETIGPHYCPSRPVAAKQQAGSDTTAKADVATYDDWFPDQPNTQPRLRAVRGAVWG